MQINIHEAKTHFSSLLQRIQKGEEIIIAKAGHPIAKLVPIESKSARKPGILKDVFNGELCDSFFDSLPEEELDAWEQIRL